jgi:hypothetical protein
MFLRNVGWLSTDFVALYSRNENSSLFRSARTDLLNCVERDSLLGVHRSLLDPSGHHVLSAAEASNRTEKLQEEKSDEIGHWTRGTSWVCSISPKCSEVSSNSSLQELPYTATSQMSGTKWNLNLQDNMLPEYATSRTVARIRFPMRSLDFSLNLILPAAL